MQLMCLKTVMKDLGIFEGWIFLIFFYLEGKMIPIAVSMEHFVNILKFLYFIFVQNKINNVTIDPRIYDVTYLKFGVTALFGYSFHTRF